MNSVFDCIIVGLGAHGSAVLAKLSKSMNVLGIEAQQSTPHTSGSHNGETRIVREMWYDETEYIELARRSLAKWQQMGYPLYKQTGGLTMGRTKDIQFNTNATQLNPKLKLLTQEEVNQYPVACFVYDAQAGYVNPELVISHFIREALSNKAQILYNSKYIKHKQESNSEITVFTDTHVLRTKKLVLTLGMGAKYTNYDLKLSLQKQQIYFFDCPFKEFENLPVFLGEIDSILVYGFPPVDGQLKIGLHFYGPEIVYPENYDRNVTNHQGEQTLRRFFAEHMPLMQNQELIRAQTCMYASTPDHHFVIDFVEDNVILVSACSGRKYIYQVDGFKFSNIMGEVVQEMFKSGKAPYDLFKLKKYPKL